MNDRSEYYRQWSINNKDALRSYGKEYYKHHREIIKDRATKRYNDNTPAIRSSRKARYLSNRQKELDRNSLWRINNPEKYHASRADSHNRRRARLKNLPSEKYNRLAIYEKFGGYCLYCDEKIDKSLTFPNLKSFTIHHIIPIAKGGGDIPGNVAPAHFICNMKIGTRVPIAIRPRVLNV